MANPALKTPFSFQNAEAEALFRNPRVPKFVITGECGTGKSSIISTLCPGASATQIVGRNPRGVTKGITVYVCSLPNGAKFLLLDTPGVGDCDVTAEELLLALEMVLSEVAVHGILIVCKNWDRVNLGGKLVVSFMELAFKSNTHKWDNMIFTFTHKDKFAEDMEILPDTLKAFNDEVNKDVEGAMANASRFAAVACPKQGTPDVAELLLQVQQVAILEGLGMYRKPASKDLARATANFLGKGVTGMKEIEDLTRKFDEARAELVEVRAKAAKVDQLERDLKEMEKVKETVHQHEKALLEAKCREAQLERDRVEAEKEAALAKAAKKSTWLGRLARSVATLGTLGIANFED
eukprot:TRINITY_DN67052_c1_g2_i1.p2 TRINITY_DN67052_c1_g2~~TRINITY_DN67052_c1_g2_i1.p2  ORF type:complete len:369 (+),score=70.68 TRINITY_DN67052_c1_g2_i1:57-1109(+)